MALDPKIKAVGFDMDGTFMKTKVDYPKLANVIFDEMVSMGVPESAIDRAGGSKFELDSGVNWLIQHGRTDDVYKIQGRVSDRATAVEMEYADIAVPFDGSLEVLDALKAKGYKVGILTRGGHSYAKYVLESCGAYDKFDSVIARDDFEEKYAKPSPQAMVNLGNALGVKANEILYLGDHKFDWFTARDSGASFYGVMTGHYPTKDQWTKECGEEVPVLNSVKDLLDLI